MIAEGVLSKNALLSATSLTGYSGGGKKMIAEYESEDRDALLSAPRQYALTQQHKHLKEMKAIAGVDNAPIFCPIVADFYSGMMVTVPLFGTQFEGGMSAIKAIYREKYTGEIVRFVESADEGGFLSGATLSKRDGMIVTVAGNEDRVLLIACYDNLGKGASGAAIECMNMVIGAERTKGLVL